MGWKGGTGRNEVELAGITNAALDEKPEVDKGTPQMKAGAKSGHAAKTPAKGKKRVSKRPAASTPEELELPDGWKVDSKVRAKGASKGVTDYYYYSPDGQKFDSIKKVKAFLSAP